MRFLILGLVLSFALSFAGCATSLEFGKNILGFSTKALEENRDTGASRNFEKSFDECYLALRDALNGMGASVFVEKYYRHLIVAIGFEGAIDTTEVGIFFDEVSPTKTLIEIVSLNRTLQIKASDKIFAFMDKRFNSESSAERMSTQDAENTTVNTEIPLPMAK